MKANIRKIGNRAGIILPAGLLKKFHLSEGSEIEISENGRQIVITPHKNKPRYTLKELLAQCDLDTPMPDTVKEWDDVQSAGHEAL